MARITKKDLEERVKVLEEDLLETMTINKVQKEVIDKNKNRIRTLKNNKIKTSELKQEVATLSLICVAHKEKIKEYASTIINLESKLKVKEVQSFNFLIVIKNWLNSFKDKNKYIVIYTSLLVILGFTFATSALGLGLVGTTISKGVGSFVFNVINILYLTLFVYIVGVFQDWWSKLYNKLKELKEKRNIKSN